jgi:hypothetical protein
MANLTRRLDALTRRVQARAPINCPYAWTSGFVAYKPENRQLIADLAADYRSYSGVDYPPADRRAHAGNYGLDLFTKSGLDYDNAGAAIVPADPTPAQARTIGLLSRLASAAREYTLATGDHFPFIGWGLRLEEIRSRQTPGEPCK